MDIEFLECEPDSLPLKKTDEKEEKEDRRKHKEVVARISMYSEFLECQTDSFSIKKKLIGRRREETEENPKKRG